MKINLKMNGTKKVLGRGKEENFFIFSFSSPYYYVAINYYVAMLRCYVIAEYWNPYGKTGHVLGHRALKRRTEPALHLSVGMALHSRARVYPDVNSHNPREYWDYESYVVDWG